MDFVGNVDVNNDIPTDRDFERVKDLLVLDSKGQSRPFKELYSAQGVAPRQLIIFIRHFFCGVRAASSPKVEVQNADPESHRTAKSISAPSRPP